MATNTDPFELYGYRVSYARKKANDFQLIKDLANYYDRAFFSSSEVKSERRKLEINYNLYNGRTPTLQEYKDTFTQYAYGDDLKYSDMVANYEQIEHHPIRSDR